MTRFDFDVALSFAGEQRAYVEGVAKALQAAGLRVFYDDFETADLWGKDLYEHLDEVYQRRARFCILFASADYAQKVWPTHERRSAQARALRQHEEYILPVLFDDTQIPGLRDTVSHLSAARLEPREVATTLIQKIGRDQLVLPPQLRAFRKSLAAIRLNIDEDLADALATDYCNSIRRMHAHERQAVAMAYGWSYICSSSLRVVFNLQHSAEKAETTPAHFLQSLRDLSNLGLAVTEHSPNEPGVWELHWVARNYLDTETREISHAVGSIVAMALIRSLNPGCGCIQCAIDSLDSLDFRWLNDSETRP